MPRKPAIPNEMNEMQRKTLADLKGRYSKVEVEAISDADGAYDFTAIVKQAPAVMSGYIEPDGSISWDGLTA